MAYARDLWCTCGITIICTVGGDIWQKLQFPCTQLWKFLCNLFRERRAKCSVSASLLLGCTVWTEGGGNGSFKEHILWVIYLEIYTTEYLLWLYKRTLCSPWAVYQKFLACWRHCCFAAGLSVCQRIFSLPREKKLTAGHSANSSAELCVESSLHTTNKKRSLL